MNTSLLVAVCHEMLYTMHDIDSFFSLMLYACANILYS